ncbi:hypothetical protein [Kitasatospora sp. NBC_01300]|uniref:hypothetical protein n=1 Tax=Kitasatospora sp. NBC_01300 TaxID=2903574 RepID=UPI00352E32B3|nr:hypothetical protein OG556_01665 [Kitasatospora sp. NBC_01300]
MSAEDQPSADGASGSGGPSGSGTDGPVPDRDETASGYPDPDDADDLADLDRDFPGRRYVIYAPNGNINTGAVHGGQRVENAGAASAPGGPHVEAHEGPISALEILDARAGFAQPEWFPSALRQLDTGLLFLAGEPGTGRRTAALNLLFQHSGHSTKLRALDSDEDLSTWRPRDAEARGYLVHGLLPTLQLGPAVVANLRRLLADAKARMVVMLPHDPDLLRSLARDLDLTPVRCVPPPPGAVFEARLEAAVPDPDRRRRLLERLRPGLDDLLASELMPAQVAELVAEVARAGDDGPDLADLRRRLSFLAEKEVPDLLKKLRDDPDGLAFLLATSVFEGLDHRIVRDEADRLLKLADGRLAAVLPAGGDDGQSGAVSREAPRPNPRFVFRRSLDELLATVRAECAPGEIRATSRYTYTVEPVRFTRHRQAETVLRHVWRQYGELSGLLTEWMDAVPGTDPELAAPLGRVMGLAAGWGGGRRALRDILELARSDRQRSRRTAAFALGIAAQDPVLAGEVKYRLRNWSHEAGWQVRSTVAFACGEEFGTSRPELALSLLRGCYRGREGDERAVATAVDAALWELFASGNQPVVLRELMDWTDRPGRGAELALRTFPRLLWDRAWFQAQLTTVGEFTDTVITFIRLSLNDDDLFDETRRALLSWCASAVWNEPLRVAVETLLTALAQEMSLGEMRLFVEIDGDDNPDLVGRHIAQHALDTWRRGGPQPYRPAPADGGAR